jgi:HPt (histidine-containing phosphotransfer) domain-containing protein
VRQNLQPLNAANFQKMAYGDPAGLAELAFDFFNETRHLMTGWAALVESGGNARLCEELHRCKGGASLFGLERLVELLSECERPAFIEQSGFDIAMFEEELSAAEAAVMAMAKTAPDAYEHQLS